MFKLTGVQALHDGRGIDKITRTQRADDVRIYLEDFDLQRLKKTKGCECRSQLFKMNSDTRMRIRHFQFACGWSVGSAQKVAGLSGVIKTRSLSR